MAWGGQSCFSGSVVSLVSAHEVPGLSAIKYKLHTSQ